MINLLYIENNAVRATPEALLLKEFKAIWDKDKSKDKAKALSAFAYIKFMLHPGKDNPFYGYKKEDERKGQSRREKILEKLPDFDEELYSKEIEYAMELYENLANEASPSKRYYDACVTGIDKQIRFLETVKFEERDDKGRAVHTPKDTNQILKDAHGTLDSLNKMKAQVDAEMFEATKTTKNREISKYERKPVTT
ncbi:hypothetical protein FACS1894195_1390 [Bacteroidia bacterium]|nr:hypothetical protein FACS1894195_1390 [Bacteroidia bacterium]